MSMQKLKCVILGAIVLSSFLTVEYVHASQGRGGGNAKESDLRYFIGMMDPYFQSSEGKQTFPEIVSYDATHAPEESFHDLIYKIHPVVINGPVRDSFQDDRDCVADFGDKNNLRFTCNGNALPAMKTENHPTLYRIVLHELFVVAGIEKPISKAIPSDYSVSFRITTNVHLETMQAWVPGTANPKVPPCAALTDAQRSIIGQQCITTTGAIFTRVERIYFGQAWQTPDGTIWGDLVGRYMQKEAVENCSNVGGVLPSRSDFFRAQASGFREVLPNITKTEPADVAGVGHYDAIGYWWLSDFHQNPSGPYNEGDSYGWTYSSNDTDSSNTFLRQESSFLIYHLVRCIARSQP